MGGWHKTSRHARGYGSEWDKLRKVALQRDCHLCQPCLIAGRYTPATEVDHITPKAKGGTDEADNLQSICRDCHQLKTEQENGAKPRLRFDIRGRPVWPD